MSHELEHNVLAFDAQRQLHLLASITAPEARDDVNDDQRSPVDLVAVLDRYYVIATPTARKPGTSPTVL